MDVDKVKAMAQELLQQLQDKPEVLTALAVGAAVLLIGWVVVDGLIESRSVSLYPSTLDLRCLVYQLGKRMIVNGSKWKRLVKKEGFKLSDDLKIEVPFNPVANHVERLSRVSDLPEGKKELPLIYPAIQTIYPLCRVFGSSDYPFPALGSVHVSSTVTVNKPMPIDGKYTFIVKVDPVLKPAKKGTLVTAISTVLGADKSVYCSNTCTFLVLHKQTREVAAEPKQDENVEGKPVVEQTWKLPGNMGIKYSDVSGDINGIHRSVLIAKAFGFPGIIMHGMYFLLRCAAECEKVLGEKHAYPVDVTCKFIRPVVIPGTVTFNIYDVSSKGAKGRTLRYQVVTSKGKVACDGTVTESK